MRISMPASGLGCLLACGLFAACGGGSASSPATAGGASGRAGGGTPAPAGGGVAALAAEAQATATGDIPDNQVFLTFGDRRGGYSMQYPEGWALRGSGGDVAFQEKNNLIHVVVASGPPPTPASVTAELARERSAQPSLTYGPASTLSIQGAPVLKVGYATLSQVNPVTGKRVRLLVDRYVFARAGRVATLDLGTPKGVDNVDAYRKISRSFRWR